MTTRSVRVALLGCGTVGLPVAAALCDPSHRAALSSAAGVDLELVGVAVEHASAAREGVPAHLVVGEAAALIREGSPDVVIEVIGGNEPARSLIEAAMEAGASVVTANKALLATQLRTLATLADSRGVDLYFEAAVAGAVPVVSVLRTSLAGQRIRRVLGIVNGTTNFILTTMANEGLDYDGAIRAAQALGLAERDPSADVDGDDAAQKSAILAALAFGVDVVDAQVSREGIANVTSADLDAAARMGHVVRLLAVAERVGDHEISVRVHPTMLARDHALAAIEGATNAVFVDVEGAGPLMLTGAGAGPATASAVLGDLVAAARNRASSSRSQLRVIDDTLALAAHGEVESAFYLSIEVADRPGVLAAVASVFGDHDVSIRLMEQVGVHDDARLVFVTHRAKERDVHATVDALSRLDVVVSTGVVLHVVDEGAP